MRITVLVATGIIGCVSLMGSSGCSSPNTAPKKTDAVVNIERVLQQDALTSRGAKTVAEVVSRLRGIDTTGCPNDFKAAFLTHIHAWENMADVEQEAIALKANSESGDAMAEAFIRGFLGDPFGKANEIVAAKNQLQRNYQVAYRQVKTTYQRVEEIAVANGASLPGQVAPTPTSDTTVPENKGTVVGIDGLQSRTPANWKEEQPGNKLRAYHFRVPKTKDDPADAEMVIFFFGPGGGGGAEENIKRWKAMFLPPVGKKFDDGSKVEKYKVGKVNVTSLDVQGTYLFKERPFDPNAKVEKKFAYRMLGVVFESENGPYFFRLLGPAKTVESNKQGFDAWVKGFK